MKKTLLIFSICTFYFSGNAQQEINNEEITYRKGEYLGVSIPLKDLPSAEEKSNEIAKDPASILSGIK